MRNAAFASALLIFAAAGPIPAFGETLYPSAALQKLKTPPKKYSEAPEVVTEWAEATDPCEPEKICVDGVLYNRGRQTARNVRVLVEIGGSKYGKPRTSFHRRLEETEMGPEDRQDFSFTIDRKIPYKDKGEMKEIEVGKYNFKIIPVWSNK